MYKLCFYVVKDFLEPVKQAIFAAGAGHYNGFKNCCWQTRGDGQYQPENESLVKQVEYKVEVYCQDKKLDTILKTLKVAHPCDEPIYDFIKLDNE